MWNHCALNYAYGTVYPCQFCLKIFHIKWLIFQILWKRVMALSLLGNYTRSIQHLKIKRTHPGIRKSSKRSFYWPSYRHTIATYYVLRPTPADSKPSDVPWKLRPKQADRVRASCILTPCEIEPGHPLFNLLKERPAGTRSVSWGGVSLFRSVYPNQHRWKRSLFQVSKRPVGW